MFLLFRRFRRLLMLLPVLGWLWKERHVLGGMAGFARTVPDRMRLGRGSEVALATKVNWALLREDRLHGADVRLGSVQGSDVVLEAGRGAEAAAEVARRIVERIPGVSSVRVEDVSARPASGRPSVVAGTGDVRDIADVPVRV